MIELIILLITSSSLSYAGVFRNQLDSTEYGKILLNSVMEQTSSNSELLSSELMKVQNEWERSGKFEGDILFTKQQIEAIVSGDKNAINTAIGLWPNKTVYYEINATYFDADQIKAIENAVADINRISCLKILPRIDEETAFINVQGKDEGCFATIGYVRVLQDLNLTPSAPGSGCFKHGTIIHEFLHSIGFFHMQSIPIRDEYVKIIWEKIKPGKESNFIKLPSFLVNDLGMGYDYGSVMHYSEYGFSIDGNKTIVPLKPTNETIGQSYGMSESDIMRLNKLYNCT